LDIATYKNDVWGQEVLRGVSWDLLWLVIVLAGAGNLLTACGQSGDLYLPDSSESSDNEEK